MAKHRRWLIWLVIPVVAVGGLFYVVRRSRSAEFHQDPNLIFVREFHTHLLEPGITLTPQQFSSLDLEAGQLHLAPRLWHRFRPATLVAFHQIYALDLLVAEQLHTGRGTTLKFSLNALPQLLTGTTVDGESRDLTVAAGMGLAGSRLQMHLQEDGAVQFNYRQNTFRLPAGDAAFLLQVGSRPWTVVPSGSEEETILQALEQGKPMSGLAVFNLGPWPTEAFVPTGGV